MIESVHAFGQSVIGFYFLTFLGAAFLLSIILVIVRWNALRATYEVSSLLSKDGSFIFTNQLFMGLGFAVLYGTMYSFFSELLGGRKVNIDEAFFNRIGIPVGLVILGLIAVCQLLAWKQASADTLAKKFLTPATGTVIAAVVLWGIGIRDWLALLTCAISFFILISICFEIGTTLIRRSKNWQQPFGKVLLTTITAQKPRYAGFLVHAGTVLLYIGIAISSTYKLEQEVRLAPGQSATLGGYEFQYQRLSFKEDAQKATVSAEITLAKGDKEITTIIPEKRFYGEGQREQVTTEIGLRTSLLKDIYVILVGWEEDQTATFFFIIYPLIIWIWIGGFFVFTIGIIVTILPRPRKLPKGIEEAA
jgi:cytochrome c-type biogenesis protein CcmF